MFTGESWEKQHHHGHKAFTLSHVVLFLNFYNNKDSPHHQNVGSRYAKVRMGLCSKLRNRNRKQFLAKPIHEMDGTIIVKVPTFPSTLHQNFMEELYVWWWCIHFIQQVSGHVSPHYSYNILSLPWVSSVSWKSWLELQLRCRVLPYFAWKRRFYLWGWILRSELVIP